MYTHSCAPLLLPCLPPSTLFSRRKLPCTPHVAFTNSAAAATTATVATTATATATAIPQAEGTDLSHGPPLEAAGWISHAARMRRHMLEEAEEELGVLGGIGCESPHVLRA